MPDNCRSVTSGKQSHFTIHITWLTGHYRCTSLLDIFFICFNYKQWKTKAPYSITGDHCNIQLFWWCQCSNCWSINLHYRHQWSIHLNTRHRWSIHLHTKHRWSIYLHTRHRSIYIPDIGDRSICASDSTIDVLFLSLKLVLISFISYIICP